MGRATLLLWQHWDPQVARDAVWDVECSVGCRMLWGMQDALLHRACVCGWLCSVSSPDQQLLLYPCLLIPALTVPFIADLLFLCISKEMQIWNLIRRMRHDSQCLPNSLASVSTSIRDRSCSSFNRQYSGSSEHPSRKKSPKIMIHFLKCCLSLSPLKIKTSLLIQGSFHSVTNAGVQVWYTQTWSSPQPWARGQSCLQSALEEQPWPRRPHPASPRGAEPSSAINGSCSVWKQHNVHQIANGAEIKHSS